MSDTREILAAAARLRRASEPFLIATVVCVHGSAYRRPGARMLLTADRWVAGSVSGGCLEGDVVTKGAWRLGEARAKLVTYDSRPLGDEDASDAGGDAPPLDDVAWGLGCDGVVDVLLERVEPDGAAAHAVDALRFFEHCASRQERGVLVTVYRSSDPRTPVGARIALTHGGAVDADPMGIDVRAALEGEARLALDRDGSEVFAGARSGLPVDALIEVVAPPPRLFVFGAGHDAVPVVHTARALGWEVIVYEPNARFATRERFAQADHHVAGDSRAIASMIDASARAVAIVMGHHYERDRAHLGLLLNTRVLYIGCLGPRRRTDRMLTDLSRGSGGKDVLAADPRLHAPVGLELGAESPPEIALAIVAEIQSVLARATAASLRERHGPIHAAVLAAE